MSTTVGSSPGAALTTVRALWLAAAMAVAFVSVGGQLIRLAARGDGPVRLQMTEPIGKIYARPDIVDRNGRLIATDLEAHSLYADPAQVVDGDEVAERLATMFPDLDAAELRRQLADKSRHFVWVRRGLTPGIAQRVHDLGMPGLGFRREPKRTYPAGRLAGHILGGVSIDNKGLGGVERYLDEALGLEPGLGAGSPDKPPVRLTIDLGVQHGIEEELSAALVRYRASGAAGLMLDVESGAILGAASLPDVDPARPGEAQEADRIDRLQTATYELGSIFKAITVAMALDYGLATLDTVYDVRVPLTVGGYLIRDLHPVGRPLNVREIFIHSSNVGAGQLALAAGPERQRAFLARLGLTEPMRTEAGPVTAPRLPERWGMAELVTIAYGHGIAVAPLQFAAAAAALVNGGRRITPTLVMRSGFLGARFQASEQVIQPQTSAMIRELLRRNVIQPGGTGRRADVPGYEVGGKTGTAEIAAGGGYRDRSVVASFLAAFPMRAPRYVLLVTLIEPQPEEAGSGQITAAVNAAPVAARIIARAAPLAGLMAQ